MISIHRARAFSRSIGIALPLLAAALAGWPALCVAAEETASAPLANRPFLALVLPLESPDFAAPANAVAQGCRISLELAGNPLALQIVRTDAVPSTIVSAYHAAIERGAAVVVGPMTRDGVTALTRNNRAAAPTLTLNAPDGEAALPSGFFAFGLSAENEARLIARAAFASGRRQAGVVQARSALARRMALAFTGEWLALGGVPTETLEFGQDATLKALRQRLAGADVVFLSGDAADARIAAPYLPRNIPIYTTSVVHTMRADPLGSPDLDGIRLFEMPWLVQPDHPAVMVYPRSEAIAGDLQRFYALGIDACRLAPLLARHQETIQLDGVTGHIRLGAGGVLEREPVAAVFRGGTAVRDAVQQ